MAVDYKTLQALATSRPRDADAYCPECGRPWRDPSPERPRLAGPLWWRAALLGAVGLALAITFGLRAGRAERLAPRDCTALPETAWQVLARRGRTVCAAASTDKDRWAESGITPGQVGAAGRGLPPDLLPTAGGVALVLVGVGGLLRPRLRARAQRRTALAVVAIWAAGEALLAGVCLQVLALCVGLVAARICPGQPLTGETLDRATDAVLVFLSTMAGR